MKNLTIHALTLSAIIGTAVSTTAAPLAVSSSASGSSSPATSLATIETFIDKPVDYVANMTRAKGSGEKADNFFRLSTNSFSSALQSQSANGPQRAISTATNLQAFVTYHSGWSSPTANVGLYKIPVTANQQFSAIGLTEQAPNYGGYYKDGIITGIYALMDGNSVKGLYTVTFDTESGEVTNTTTLGSSGISLMAMDVDIDPTTGDVYGCYYRDDGNGFCWGKGDYSAATRTSIRELEAADRLIAVGCSASGQFYGLTYDSRFVKVDKTTGEYTLVAQTTVPVYNLATGVVDNDDNVMIVSYNTSDESGLYEIDLSTGTATKALAFDEDVILRAMFIPTVEDRAIPMAPTNVALALTDGELVLTWEAVTTSTDGANLNASDVSYTIYRNDEVVASGLTTTTWSPEDFEEPIIREEFTYSVVANYNGQASQAAASNTLILGAYGTPYSKSLQGKQALSDMTVIDANNDNSTWIAPTSDAAYVYYKYSRTNVADDWLITPGIYLEADKAYELNVGLGTYNAYNEEKFEIYLGTEPTADGMTIEVVEPTATKNPNKNLPVTTAMMQVPTTGVYYLGVHAISEKNKMFLYCRSIDISDGAAPSAPNDLQNVSFTPEPTGDLTVDVAFTAPTTDIMGNEYTDNVNVKLLRDNQEIQTWSIAPGESASYTDQLAHRGMYTYDLIPYNTNGDEGRTSSSGSIYVGPYGAAAPSSVTVEETPEQLGQVHISWPAVTQDVKGTTISAENVTYQVYRKTTNGMETNFLEPFPETEIYLTPLTDPSQQSFVSYCAAAFNRNIMGDYSPMSDLTCLGTPVDMPISISGATDVPLGINATNGVDFCILGKIEASGVSPIEAQDGDGMMIVGIGSAYGNSGELHTGKIDLSGSDVPQLEFYTCRINSSDRNTVTVYVKADNQRTQVAQVLHANLTTGTWTRTRVDLSAYKDKVIQVIFVVKVQGCSHTPLDNISIKEATKYDLAAQSISVDGSSFDTNEEFNVVVSVINDGVNEVSNVPVLLYRNDEVVAESDIESLAAGATTSVSFPQTLNLFSSDKTSYYAEIMLDEDENPDNNVSETTYVTRNISDLEPVSGLVGQYTDDGIVISWTPYDNEHPLGKKLTEDFESADSWADEYGDWMFLDIDGEGIGYMIPSSTAYQIPNHPSLEPAGFFVWDMSKSRCSAYCNALSGNKFLASVYRNDEGAVEDWAISPKLSGQAQTISFYAQSYDDNSGNNPEQLQIWYATTDTDDFSQFTQLSDFGTYNVPCVRTSSNASAYTRVEADLPEGAMRFAFVSVASDNYMLMIDDVTYIPDPEVSPLLLEGYNIYRDGVKLNTELLTEASFLDTESLAEADSRTYYVTAVYEPGESELSAPLTMLPSALDKISDNAAYVRGIGREIIVCNAGTQPVAVYTVDGKVAYSGRGDFRESFGPGLYIVTVGSRAVKLILK
jgi:hypothetical protein